jgi:hypothetical protein
VGNFSDSYSLSYYGWYRDGQREYTDYGSGFREGDTVGCGLIVQRLANGTNRHLLFFTKNGQLYNGLFVCLYIYTNI